MTSMHDGPVIRLATLVAFAAFMMISLATALAQQVQQISAPDALARVEAGEMVLIDIRSREEWKESGIASVAIPVSMHEATFLDGLARVKLENPGKQVAIICATGGRTAWLQAELVKRGLGETVDVAEGMMGHPAKGPGWISRGLPLKPFGD